jgi:hypothetical protein
MAVTPYIGSEGSPADIPDIRSADLSAKLYFAQSAYYLLTGIWPLISPRTFQKVTGPKTDLWLVKTVGVLVVVIGVVLGLTGARRRHAPETVVLAVGSALGLAAIDIVYVAKGRISRVYLLDALAELLLAGMWAVAGRRQITAVED